MNVPIANRVNKEVKAKILVHIAAIRMWVKLEQKTNEFFFAGLDFNDDEMVFKHFCVDHLVSDQDLIRLESGAMDDILPHMVETSLINAGEWDYEKLTTMGRELLR